MRVYLLTVSFVLVATVELSAQATPPAAAPPDSLLHAVKPAEWWLELAENWDHRRVAAGSMWRNDSDEPVSMTMSYSVYTQKGDNAGACSVSENIAPRDSAWLACMMGPAPEAVPLVSRVRLQLVNRVIAGYVDHQQRAAIVVEESGLRHESPDRELRTAWARVRAAGTRDLHGSTLFRLYDENGIQLSTCDGNVETILHDAATRVESFSYCPVVPHHLGKVKAVKVELLVSR